MTDSQSDDKSSSPTKVMAPMGDSAKVPLADEDQSTERAENVKFSTIPSNGDAKVDLGTSPVFTGLTKEELMKYANDPFWIRLRWIIFILFWLGWAAMLVMAIIIIAQAEKCAPPPTLDWVQEGAMVEIDQSELGSIDTPDLIMKVGADSAYMSKFIDSNDFMKSNYGASEAFIKDVIEVGLKLVTDFPDYVGPTNSWRYNSSYYSFYDNATGQFNYSSPNISLAFEDPLNYWIANGVTGFLMPTILSADQLEVRDQLNASLLDGGVVGIGVVDVAEKLIDNSANGLGEFLKEFSDPWPYLKFSPNPAFALNRARADANFIRLMTIGLFGAPGTPILMNSLNLNNVTNDMVKYLIKLKGNDAIKFGGLNFVNITETNVLAYTRTKKGTPAYAVALNFEKEEQIVDFGDTPNISDSATVELKSAPDELITDNSGSKVNLREMVIPPETGLILQFVAKF